jgi:threonine dehydrogenase-like Zn-dependent dehydrogenase
VALLRGRTGPTLSTFVSFPAVLGHEVLGVAQAGALAGRRVVLDPFLPCRTRGLPPCPACAEGRTALCHRFADGALAPGMLLGYCRDLPGGWAEQVLAHESQLHEVPEGLADEAAVLAEPLAVALHAVLAAPPGPGSRVLVLGAGTIGLCVLAALRLLPGPGGVHAVAVARHPGQARLAAALGARAVSAADAAERFAVAEGWGAPRPGLLGARGWIGGFDRVFDAVGSGGSMAAALRLARAGGRVDLLGCSGRLPGLDLTWAWAHELEVHGYCGYGAEPSAGGAHTIEVAMRLQAGHPEVDLGALLTHRFPLERHREALRAAFFHRRSGAIKVAFAPGEGA